MQSGVFQLGKHEFVISSGSTNKATIKKRVIGQPTARSDKGKHSMIEVNINSDNDGSELNCFTGGDP